MVNEEIRLKRLSFAKYLISIGNLNSENIIPFSAIAILNYHDAIEFLFELILEENGISSNKYKFMECFDEINNLIEKRNKSPSLLRVSLKKLRDIRANLKHKGYFPSENDIKEVKSLTNTLFIEICEKLYSYKYDDINLVHLLNDSKTKDYLLQINKTDDDKVVIKNLSLAFEYLLKDYENNKKTIYVKSPYQFLKKRPITAHDLKLNNKDPMKKFVDELNDNLFYLEENLKILAFGINFNEYAKFRNIVPDVTWFMSGVPMVNFRGNETINENELNFCLNFIIESALRMQQFDFEIPDNMGQFIWLR